MRKSYEIRLPYFKQGDDMYHNLDYLIKNTDLEEGSPEYFRQALYSHAESLKSAANILDKLSQYCDRGLTITDAMTHFISAEVDEEIGKELVENGLLYELQDLED